jgi:hypothetical protein
MDCYGDNLFCYINIGHALAWAVCRWFSTAAARVQSQFSSCRICGGQSGIGTGFFRVLRFPLPLLIPLWEVPVEGGSR